MPHNHRQVKIKKAQIKQIDEGEGKVRIRIIANGLGWSVSDDSEFEAFLILRDKSDREHGADGAQVEIVEDMPPDPPPPNTGGL